MDCNLKHYRDSNVQEVDAIIESNKGKINTLYKEIDIICNDNY